MATETTIRAVDPLDFQLRSVPAICATCANFHSEESFCNVPNTMAKTIYNAIGVWIAEAAVDTAKTRDCPYWEVKDATLRDPVWGGFDSNPYQARAS